MSPADTMASTTPADKINAVLKMASAKNKTITFVFNKPLHREVSFETFKRDFEPHLSDAEAEAVWEKLLGRATQGEILFESPEGQDVDVDYDVDVGQELLDEFGSRIDEEIEEVKDEIKEEEKKE